MEWITWNTTANARFGATLRTRNGEYGFTFSERPSVSKPGEFTSRLQASLGPYVARLNFSSDNFLNNWSKYDMGSDRTVLKDVSFDLGVQSKVPVPGMSGKIKLVEGVSVPNEVNVFTGVSISASGIKATASITAETTSRGELKPGSANNVVMSAGPNEISTSASVTLFPFNDDFEIRSRGNPVGFPVIDRGPAPNGYDKPWGSASDARGRDAFGVSFMDDGRAAPSSRSGAGNGGSFFGNAFLPQCPSLAAPGSGKISMPSSSRARASSKLARPRMARRCAAPSSMRRASSGNLSPTSSVFSTIFSRRASSASRSFAASGSWPRATCGAMTPREIFVDWQKGQ